MIKNIEDRIIIIEVDLIENLLKEQINFINANRELGFVSIEERTFNKEISLMYDISGKEPLYKILKQGISIEQTKSIFKSLILIEELAEENFEKSNLILDSQYIYATKDKVSINLNFIYLPFKENKIKSENYTLDGLVYLIIESINENNQKEKLRRIFKENGIKGIENKLFSKINEKYSRQTSENSKVRHANEMPYEQYESKTNAKDFIWKCNMVFIVLELIVVGILSITNLIANSDFTNLIIIMSAILITHVISFIVFFKFIKHEKRIIKKEYKKLEQLEPKVLTDNTILLEENSAYLEYSIGGEDKRYTLNDMNIIGRSKEVCNIIVPHKVVSKKHVSISRNNEKFFIRDEGASNGTFLNNEKLKSFKEYKLNDNDKILLGNILCVFREG